MAQQSGGRAVYRNRNILLFNNLHLGIMEIKILGTGCGKCKTTYAVIEKVINENNIPATITKVEDIMEIMNYNILATPAVVVDGVVKFKGYVPSEREIKELLGV